MAAAGLQILPRNGTWHVIGTIRASAGDGRRRSRRVRKSTGLPAIAETLVDADALRDAWTLDFRQEIIHGRHPSIAVSIATERFLKRPRKPSWREVSMTMKIALKFKIRQINAVAPEEWVSFVEAETAAGAATTRERYLNGFLSHINWCTSPPRR